jgi:hypothetical protein
MASEKPCPLIYRNPPSLAWLICDYVARQTAAFVSGMPAADEAVPEGSGLRRLA